MVSASCGLPHIKQMTIFFLGRASLNRNSECFLDSLFAIVLLFRGTLMCKMPPNISDNVLGESAALLVPPFETRP